MKRSLAIIGLSLLAVAAWPLEGVAVFEFPRLNMSYRDMAPEIAPVSAGGLSIQLSSPANSLTIRHHQLRLERLEGNRYRFYGMVDLLGKADLVAEFDAVMASRLDDQVLLPIQQLELSGEVEIVRDTGGYNVTTRELPEHVEIAMQSRLGNQLLSLCDLMSIFSGGDCSSLEQAFSRVQLPLPPAGETYRIELERLTAAEIELLDGYLLP